MHSNIEASTTHQETLADHDERHWDRGAWLVLGIVLLLILWPLMMSLVSFSYPVDGWMSSPAGTTFTQGGEYVLLDNFSGQPSDLRSGDVVTAIDGRPLLPDALPPLPADLRFGQSLRYTIERDGQPLLIDVTLLRLDAMAIGRAFLHTPLSSLQIMVMFFLSLFVFLSRPGNHGARYLLLAFAQGVGSIANQASYSMYRTSFPPALNFLTDFYSVG